MTSYLSVIGHLKNKFTDEDRAASLVEFGLLVGLVAVVAITAVVSVGAKVNSVFSNAGDTLTDYAVAQTWTASCNYEGEHVDMVPVVGKRGENFTTSASYEGNSYQLTGVIGGAATIYVEDEVWHNACSNWSSAE